MSSRPNFLDSNPSALEKNLKFVKNEVEDELEQIFGSGGSSEAQADYKIVKPKPGMCIKCYKVNTNEKFFINLCQTDGILPPEDITEAKLHEILSSEKPSTYRIPMSISEPRLTKDKSNNNVEVCDIAINPKFFKKCEKILIFRDFLIAIILEALNDKYNIELSADNWVILKNRKLMGTLISHRIQNRDMKKVYDSYKSSLAHHDKKLIEEISKKDIEKLMKKRNKEELEKMYSSSIPEYRFYGKMKNSKLNEIIGEFFIPECISSNEITLDIGEDRILLESLKYGYSFDKFVNYSINRDHVTATFNQATKILQVQMPLIQAGGK